MPTPLTFEPSQQPSAGRTSLARKPRILKAQFAGGYSQRTADGPNAVAEEWRCTWLNLTLDEAEDLDAFLAARGAWDAFYWTPPGRDAAVLFTCEEWTVAYGAVSADLTATFLQAFDVV